MPQAFTERRRDIAHIGPVEMFTPTLEATRDFFVNQMALREVHRDASSVFLHAWDDYQRYTIRIIQREAAGIGRTFLRAASPQALQRLVARIEATGLGQGYSHEQFGLGDVYLFADPDGHPMGVYWETGRYEPDDTDRPVLKNQAAAFPGRGANVRRLDHINYLTKEIDPMDAFLRDVLGAFCTERIAREDGGYDGIWFTVTDKTYDLESLLFIDDEEVSNAPVQEFGEYRGGDIKYKDISGDGRINSDDLVPIGFPTVPEIIYGGGVSFGIYDFDVSVFFQGSARSSFFIDAAAITPFLNQGQRGLLQLIADDHWSENNRDLEAFWPRLSEYRITNNTQPSTHWLRNGSFIRLKSAEIGYTLPEEMTQKAFIQSCRLYVSGLNLYVWSKFKLWDPEMAGNGLGYPIQKVINFGIKIDI